MNRKEEKKPQKCNENTQFFNQPINQAINQSELTDYVPEWYIQGAYDTKVEIIAVAV